MSLISFVCYCCYKLHHNFRSNWLECSCIPDWCVQGIFLSTCKRIAYIIWKSCLLVSFNLVQDMMNQGWLSVSPVSVYSGVRKSPAVASSFVYSIVLLDQRSCLLFHYKNTYLVSALKPEFVRRQYRYLPLLSLYEYTTSCCASPLCGFHMLCLLAECVHAHTDFLICKKACKHPGSWLFPPSVTSFAVSFQQNVSTTTPSSVWRMQSCQKGRRNLLMKG